jgi:predicted  nucleic acid-binding Zn-ribbon protein
MERAQATGEKDLGVINALLAKLGAELADLDVKYRAAAAELKDLSDRASLMEKRLEAASKLIDDDLLHCFCDGVEEVRAALPRFPIAFAFDDAQPRFID